MNIIISPSRLIFHTIRVNVPCPHRASLFVLQQRRLGSSSPKRVIFSGIQPTGIPHIGNFAGAIQQWRRLQDVECSLSRSSRIYFSIVDLHALTTPQKSGVLSEQKQSILAALLACGLDPSQCSLFYQSSVPEHTELMWILSCTASVGYLSRMTQWKDKLGIPDNFHLMDDTVKSSLKLGLFSYPVLQAADILIHRATHVPVGEDQRQHLEFARKCATNFNHMYGKVFVYPETVLAPTRRIKSLRVPTQKMSKSDDNPASSILITDDSAMIWKKIMAAVTDSLPSVTYDPKSRPGVSNLLEILAVFDPQNRPPDVLAAELSGGSLRDLKATVASSIANGLEGISERYSEILSGKRLYLHRVQEEGAIQARASASETMIAVRSAIGL